MLASLQRTFNLVLKIKLPSFLHRIPYKPEPHRLPFSPSRFFLPDDGDVQAALHLHFVLVSNSILGTEAVLKEKPNVRSLGQCVYDFY